MTSSWLLQLTTTSSSIKEGVLSFCWQVLLMQVRALFLAEMSRPLSFLEMVQRISKFKLFTLDKDPMFALGILSNLTNGLEILSVKGEGFILVLPASFLEYVFTEG